MSKPIILHHICSRLYLVQSRFHAINAIILVYKFRVSGNSISVAQFQ